MNLCVFLAIGESWEDFEKKGQDTLLLQNNFHFYQQYFDKTWVFSYGKKEGRLLPNVVLVGNRWGLNRFIYILLLPFFHWNKISQASLFRGYQLTGAVPAVVSQFIFGKPAVFNYGYDYAKIAQIEGRSIYAYLFSVLTQILVRLARGVIVTTEQLKKRLLTIRKNIVIIPNSVDTSRFRPKKMRKTIGALFVGRLEPQKNLFLLLSAWSQLPSTLREEKLVFIGSGNLKKKLHDEAKRLGILLEIRNPLPHSDLPDIYNRTHMFVLPSLLEGHPKALLEAMSCEVPVIGTNVSGIRELIKHNVNGLLIQSSVKDLSQSMETVFRSSVLRVSLGKSGRKYIIRHFSAKKIWAKEIEFLKTFI